MVVAGGDLPAGSQEGFPAQVRIVPDAPRAWMLARATLMITSAGLEAMRAAIAHRVPMIAIPLAADQAGNAERIAQLGIGLRLRAALLSPGVLEAAIRAALAHRPRMCQRLEQLDDACRAEHAAGRGVTAVEALRAAAPGPARLPQAAARAMPAARMDDVDGDESSAAFWFAHASACAERVLGAHEKSDPDRVAVLRELLRGYGVLLQSGTDPDGLRRLRAETGERAAAQWHRGYGAVLFALHPQARRGALLARLEAAAALAHLAAGTGSDEERSERFNEAYAVAARELDAALGWRPSPASREASCA
jgi:hypothetical protein